MIADGIAAAVAAGAAGDATEAARSRRALRLLPAMGTLRVTGPDRVRWLNGLVTCDVQRALPGKGVFGLALSRTGKIQSTLWVLADENALWVGTAPGTAPGLLPEFDRMLVMEDAELQDVSQDFEWVLSVGPASAELPAEWTHAGGTSGLLDLLGIGARALVVPRGTAASRLQAAPEPVLDDAAWLQLRLERGVAEFGVDFGPQERPHEAGLDRLAVDWSKGCYLGQEVVCMQDLRGKVSRRLQRVQLAADAGEIAGAALRGADSERDLAKLTSVSYSARAAALLGWALLPLPVPLQLQLSPGGQAVSLFEGVA